MLLLASMTTAPAYRHHLMKIDASDDLYGHANHAMNSSLRAINHMWTSCLKKHGGLNTPSMFEAIKKYGKGNPEVTLTVDQHDDCFCVVVITPFMKRIQKELREAEVVFVDATGCQPAQHFSYTLHLCRTSQCSVISCVVHILSR